MTVVFDSSSILRYLQDKAGADRVSEVFEECLAGKNRALVSSVQWGEVASVACRDHGIQFVEAILAGVLALGLEVVPATQERAVRSGILKSTKKIPYADCFAVELAGESPEHLLITADYDFKAVEKEIRIEFLPTNSRPS